MPQVSFNIASGKYANIPKAIIAYNVENPENPLIDEDDFCKKASLEALQVYMTRYRNLRFSMVQEQIEACSDSQWAQVTGILLS